MAIFEKDRASRRYYSLSIDDNPTATGGVPTGSIVHFLDTGEMKIFDGKEWQSWSQEAEIVSALGDVEQAVHDLLPHIRVIRAASAVMANDQSGGDFSTDDE